MLQPLLILSQGQIPVFGGLLYQAVARVVLIGGVDKLFGREGSATLLALVAIGALGTAARTGAHNVAVGEKLACYLVAILFFSDLFQLAIVVQLAEEVLANL